jgi:hypothetical protein
MMRAQIAALPSGTVSAEDFLDNDGIVDEPLKIALDLTIDGDRMVMDFSRSSPACAGPVNISRSTTIAACYVALKHIFGDVPANAGVLEPVEFRIDADSLAVGHRAQTRGGLYRDDPAPDRRGLSRRSHRSRPNRRWPAPTARSTPCRWPVTAPMASAG